MQRTPHNLRKLLVQICQHAGIDPLALMSLPGQCQHCLQAWEAAECLHACIPAPSPQAVRAPSEDWGRSGPRPKHGLH